MKQYAHLYKALADETRLRILALLLSEGELCVCDIIAALKLPQSTVSRHLAILRKSGWVDDRRCGLWIYYSLRDNGAGHQELLSFLKKQLLTNDRSIEDRKLLATFSQGSNCA